VPVDQKMPSAEDHWDALIENNPDMAHAFALGLRAWAFLSLGFYSKRILPWPSSRWTPTARPD
jgi:hypothetical protein